MRNCCAARFARVFLKRNFDCRQRTFKKKLPVMKAQPIVLEPIVDIEVMTPEAAMGDIIGDLSSRRGQVHGTRALGGDAMLIAGKVPLAELDDYQSRLNALAGGHGNYSIQLSHYDAVPPAQQERLASQHKARQVPDE